MDDAGDPTISRIKLPEWPKAIGHYEIVDKLGAGGMGVVYKGLDTRLNRHVAIKLLPDAFQSDPKARKRLLQEARAAAQLDHPNICSVYSVEELPDSLGIVMQYLEGRSLKEVCADGPMPLPAFYEMALQLVAGLEAAHDKGIVHRDVKPSNVMVMPDGKAKLVDFGLASSLTHAAETTTTVSTGGTPAYMAPEVLLGQPADARSDLFALGQVFYEMLAGCSPFPHATTATVIDAILNREPAPLTTTRKDLPAELQRIVVRLLAKKPDERYQSAADLRADLERLRAQNAPAAGHAVSSGRRTRTLLWGAVTVIAVLIVAGVWFASRPPSGRSENQAIPAPAASPRTATPPAAAANSEGKVSIAALPFANMQKDPKWSQFEQGIGDAFTDSFARDGRFRVVERAQLDKVLEELKLNRSEVVDPATAQRIGKMIGARYMVVGSFQVFEGQMRLNARMVRVETGEIVSAMSQTGTASDALALSDRTAQEFRKAVKVE